MQLTVKAVLNHVHPLSSFVYADVRLAGGAHPCLEVTVTPRAKSRPICSGCGKRDTGYDRQPVRRFSFVPLWNIPVWLLYAPRRVNCRRCGVKVEAMPWALGKSPTSLAFCVFLATWAQVLSWKQVAQRFHTSWDTVFEAVGYAVTYGLNHRDLSQVKEVGIDEIAVRKGHHYVTLVYDLAASCRRLLFVHEGRREESLAPFFSLLGDDGCQRLRVICSDMWKPFRNVIARFAPHALHVLDKFHIVAHLTKAVDETRRQEAAAERKKGNAVVLKHSRWCLLKRPGNLTDRQAGRLGALLQLNLRTVKAYLLKEDFDAFWSYVSPAWAARYLDRWCMRAMRSRIEPMKKMAGMLRRHRGLILNYFRAKKQFSSGVVEGLNSRVKSVTKSAYGFRNLKILEIALLHTMGKLPMPPTAHRFV